MIGFIVFDWLNDNQGVTTTVLSFALAVVAWVSMRIARNQRHDAVRPILTLEVSNGLDFRTSTVSFTVLIVNRGPGLAFDIRPKWPSHHRFDHELHRSFAGRGATTAVLGPGQELPVMLLIKEMADADRFSMNSGVGEISITYHDVFGSHFETAVDVIAYGEPFEHVRSPLARPVMFGPMRIRRLGETL